MADDRETPQISRSGRVLKKSAKVKEMEDFDINELDGQGKSRKKSRSDDFDEFDDKRVAPIKIPKISLNMQGGVRKKVSDMTPNKQVFKQQSFQAAMKAKQDARRAIYNDSSDGSKESDSSSVSSDSSSSSSSSSDASDDDLYSSDFRDRKGPHNSGVQAMSVHQDKVIVEHQQQRYEAPVYMNQSSEMSSDDSEDAGSDTALVIAEDSDEPTSYVAKSARGGAARGGKRGGKRDPLYAPRQGGGGRKKPQPKSTETAASLKRKKPTPTKTPKAPTAYMLWCSENRKKIAAAVGNIGFANIGKKMGEAWQALPEKEKMAWKRKAKRIAMKTATNTSSTSSNASVQNRPSTSRAAASINDDLLKGLSDTSAILGTTPIDAAAHLKLLGDSLTVIGQRLIEHEGQLAVSGIYSVLLDTLLCAIGPLICLTTEVTGLENIPTTSIKKTLDHIAYFMPGL